MKIIKIALITFVYITICIAGNGEPKTIHNQSDHSNMNRVTNPVNEKPQENTQVNNMESKSSRWAFFPIVQREEETSWVFGALGMHFFPKKDSLTTRSKIEFHSKMSLKKQFHAEISPEWYLNQDRDQIYGKFIARIWPSALYPIGQLSPDTSQSFEYRTIISWRSQNQKERYK